MGPNNQPAACANQANPALKIVGDKALRSPKFMDSGVLDLEAANKIYLSNSRSPSIGINAFRDGICIQRENRVYCLYTRKAHPSLQVISSWYFSLIIAYILFFTMCAITLNTSCFRRTRFPLLFLPAVNKVQHCAAIFTQCLPSWLNCRGVTYLSLLKWICFNPSRY